VFFSSLLKGSVQHPLFARRLVVNSRVAEETVEIQPQQRGRPAGLVPLSPPSAARAAGVQISASPLKHY